MARIRTIKPEFWLDEDMATLPAETRLLAIGLLNHSDDEGYFKANPMIVRAAVFPFMENSQSVESMLKELSGINYVELFSGNDGKAYGRISNFSKHQVISRKTPSKIKGLVNIGEQSATTHGVVCEESTPEGKGKEQGKEGKGTISPAEAVFEYWKTITGKKRSKLNTTVRAKINTRLKSFSIHQLMQAIDGNAASRFHQGDNDNNRKYNSLELICRNDEKTQGFIDMASQDNQHQSDIDSWINSEQPADESVIDLDSGDYKDESE